MLRDGANFCRLPKILTGPVVWVKTGNHIPYMEMTTSFETRLHQHLHKAITIAASFVIIKEVIKPLNAFAVRLIAYM